MVLLVRNLVTDFDQWRAIFDSQADAGREAGLNVVQGFSNTDLG